MTYLMRLNQTNFGIITPKDKPSGLNTYSVKHLCLLMVLIKDGVIVVQWEVFLDLVEEGFSNTGLDIFALWVLNQMMFLFLFLFMDAVVLFLQ